MNIPTSKQGWKDLIISLYDKAKSDPQFLSLCLSDPKAALGQFLGIELPKELNVRFSQNVNESTPQKPDEIVLPVPAMGEKSELPTNLVDTLADKIFNALKSSLTSYIKSLF